MQLVVVPAVLEFLADAAADFEAEVGGDGDVAGVEEAVDVAAQEEAVAGFVFAAGAETTLTGSSSGQSDRSMNSLISDEQPESRTGSRRIRVERTSSSRRSDR